MKRVLGKIILYTGILAILLSSGLLMYAHWDDNRAGNSAGRTARELSGIIYRETAVQSGEYEDPYLEDNEEAEEETEVADTAARPPRIVEINGEMYIGIIRIPSLSLELPVNKTFNEAALENSPCLYYGDISGRAVIGAHNYKAHFGPLSQLSPGDLITITDTGGNEHRYTVELIEILPETYIDARINSPYALTLYTCTPGRTERVTVRCTKISVVKPPRAPNYKIDYEREAIRLRGGGYLYSLDGGASFYETSERAALDVSDNITSRTPIYIIKAATDKRPASLPQIIRPAARAILEDRELSIDGSGRLRLEKEYEVYDPAAGSWGRLPRITGDAEFDIRLKPGAWAENNRGAAASATGRLKVTWGVTDTGRQGVVSAVIIA